MGGEGLLRCLTGRRGPRVGSRGVRPVKRLLAGGAADEGFEPRLRAHTSAVHADFRLRTDCVPRESSSSSALPAKGYFAPLPLCAFGATDNQFSGRP